MRNVSDKIIEKIKTNILCSIIFFVENLAVYNIMWKIIRRRFGQDTGDNMAHAYAGYLRL